MSFDYEKAQEDEIADLRVKLAEELKESVRHEDEATALRAKLASAEENISYPRTLAKLTAERDVALARVKELGLSVGGYKANQKNHGQIQSHLEARIAELEGALEACVEVLEDSKADLDATGMGQPAWGRLIRAVNLGNAALGKSNV
jgi:chromosome segregation ATPase